MRDDVAPVTPWQKLPLWPPTSLNTARLPIAALRDRLFRVAGGEDSSLLGRCVSRLEACALVLYVACFSLASVPDFRERLPGDFGRSAIPSRVLFGVELATSAFFLLLFLARLLTVTAVPGRHEALALAAESLRGSRGSEAQSLLYSEGGGGGGAAGGRGGGEEAAAVSSSEEEAWGVDDAAPPGSASTSTSSYAARQLDGAALAGVLRSGRLPTQVFASGCSYERGGASRLCARLLEFALLPGTAADVMSWLPQVLDAALGGGGADPGLLALMRALGFARVLRLLRGTAETVAFKILRRSLSRAGAVLAVSFLPATAVVVVAFSCAMFICERGVWGDGGAGVGPTWLRPDSSGTALQPSPFRSVFHSAWFVVVTLTTLGYGDLTPTSVAGKLVTTLLIGFSVVLIAVPATVIGWNFSGAYQRHLQRERARTRLARERSRAAFGGPSLLGLLGGGEAGASPAARGAGAGGSPVPSKELRAAVEAAMARLRGELRAEVRGELRAALGALVEGRGGAAAPRSASSSPGLE